MLRLLLALVLALASIPMPAMACGTGGPAAPMAMAVPGLDHSRHHAPEAPMPPKHDCIGCISIADWNGARIAPPVLVAIPVPTRRIVALPLLPGEAPTPPPPRVA